MAPKNIRSRAWCFTLNNYTVEEYTKLQELNYSYIVLGEEVGEKKHTPHIQGYVEFKNAKSMDAFKNDVSLRLHLEKRKGTPQEASDYCKKDGCFFEDGHLSHQGRASALDQICEMVQQKKNIQEIALYAPKDYVRYNRGINAFAQSLQKDRDPNFPPQVFWFWGKSGTGKTRTATESNSSFYIKDSSKWWDGYNGQDAIIIDDFDPEHWPYRDFLRLLDRYPYQGQTKGGYVKINSPKIYITCEFEPKDFWSDNCLTQVCRRISETRMFS